MLLLLVGSGLAAAGIRALWPFRAVLSAHHAGQLHLTGPPVHSPLNDVEGVYIQWVVQRRLLSRGVDDAVSGEETAGFVLRADAPDRRLDLDAITLHLSNDKSDAWTAELSGLPERLRAALAEHLRGEEPDALYHLRHVVLPAETRVTFFEAPPLLTDMTAEAAKILALKLLVLRVLIGLILAGVGLTWM